MIPAEQVLAELETIHEEESRRMSHGKTSKNKRKK